MTQPHPLSRREVQLLSFAAEGMSAKDIARALMVAPRMVDQHFEHLKAKTAPAIGRI